MRKLQYACIEIILLVLLAVFAYPGPYGDGDDYYQISGSTEVYMPGNSNWAMTFWYYGMKNNSYPYGSYAASGVQRCYTEIYTSDAYIIFNSRSCYLTGFFTDAQWHHFAIVRKYSSDIQVWFDGSVKGTSTTDDGTVFNDTAQPWRMMGLAPSYFINGCMQDVRIYKDWNIFSTSTIRCIIESRGQPDLRANVQFPLIDNTPTAWGTTEVKLIPYTINNSSMTAPLKQVPGGDE